MVGVVIAARGIPRPGAFAVFALLAAIAELTQVQLPTGMSTSPVIVPVLAGAYVLGGAGSYLAAALVGGFAGLHVIELARRRYAPVAFNCAVFLLSGSVAAAIFSAFDPADAESPTRFIVATLPAGFAFLLVNMALVVPMVALHTGRAPAALIREMHPFHLRHASLPLVGSALGWMYVEMGPVVVVLSMAPVLIARLNFVAYLHLRDVHEGAVATLVRVLEHKDPYTAGHAERVASLADRVARELGLSPARRTRIRQAALLHDVGKLIVPTRLLNKPGRLTAAEYDLVKTHDHVSTEVLRHIGFLEPAAAAFPRHSGFAPPSSPIEAGIIAVVDAYDAMTSSRSYRRALAHEVVVAELRTGIGTQFDAACVQALIGVLQQDDERQGDVAGLQEEEIDLFPEPPPPLGPGSAGLGHLAPSFSGPDRPEEGGAP